MRFEGWIDSDNPEDVRRQLYGLLAFTSLRNRSILHDDPHFPKLYKSGVRYGLDTDIAEVQRFLTCRQVLEQRYACCKSLCAWRHAELQHEARSEAEAERVDFDIQWEDRASDPLNVGLQPRNGYVRLWHVNVRKADGSVENPSRKLRALEERPGLAGAAARRWPGMGKLRALR